MEMHSSFQTVAEFTGSRIPLQLSVDTSGLLKERCILIAGCVMSLHMGESIS